MRQDKGLSVNIAESLVSAPICIPVEQVWRMLGIGKTNFYSMVESEIPTFLIGRNRYAEVKDLEAFIERRKAGVPIKRRAEALRQTQRD